MNAFTDLLFIFIFLYIMFFFGIPKIANKNYLLDKLVIFAMVFIFNYIIQIIKKIRSGCKIEQDKLIRNSMDVAITAVVGYSIFVDLTIMDWSADAINSIYAPEVDGASCLLALVATSVIMMVISSVKITELLFMYNNTNSIDCR